MAGTEEVGKLIEKMTTSGKKELDANELKKLKKLCRDSGDSLVGSVFRMLWTQLAKKHSQVRFATVLVMDQLFTRSHCFRTDLLSGNNFQRFMELTTSIGDKPLPPPKQFAKDLDAKTIELVDKWYNQFGTGYPLLRNAYNHMKEKRIVDFRDRVSRNVAQRQREEAEEARKKALLKQKVEKVVNEFRDLENEAKTLLIQMNSCFELLFPNVEREADNSADDDFAGEDIDLKHGHGITSVNYSIDVTVPSCVTIRRSSDTEAVIDNVRDVYKQITNISLPKLKKVMQEMTKGSDLCENELKKAINLKSEIMGSLKKFVELKILEADREPSECDDRTSDTSDDDFEPVEQKEVPEYVLIMSENRTKDSAEVADGAGGDLYPQPSTSSGISGATRTCDAPLPSGKLCPRRDRLKCPFHGRIIARDNTGAPINAKEGEEVEKELKRQKGVEGIPDWQDPQLLKEIEAATGVDLTLPSLRKRRGGTKRKYPGLKDVRSCDKGSRDRLGKKVYSKSSRQRVAYDLQTMDDKRADKFEDQWNYALNR